MYLSKVENTGCLLSRDREPICLCQSKEVSIKHLTQLPQPPSDWTWGWQLILSETQVLGWATHQGEKVFTLLVESKGSLLVSRAHKVRKTWHPDSWQSTERRAAPQSLGSLLPSELWLWHHTQLWAASGFMRYHLETGWLRAVWGSRTLKYPPAWNSLNWSIWHAASLQGELGRPGYWSAGWAIGSY